MSDFKFRVGELVECDSSYTLQERKFLVFTWHKKVMGSKALEGVIAWAGHHQTLPNKIYEVNGILWSEECLSRKFLPGDSFDKLIADLKRPVGAGEVA